jgi:hypothetical protein
MPLAPSKHGDTRGEFLPRQHNNNISKLPRRTLLKTTIRVVLEGKMAPEGLPRGRSMAAEHTLKHSTINDNTNSNIYRTRTKQRK